MTDGFWVRCLAVPYGVPTIADGRWEQFAPGAFSASLDKFTRPVKVTWDDHSERDVVATTEAGVNLFETATGLWAEVLMPVERRRNVADMIRRIRPANGCSIFFRGGAHETVQLPGYAECLQYNSADLVHISIGCEAPVYPSARCWLVTDAWPNDSRASVLAWKFEQEVSDEHRQQWADRFANAQERWDHANASAARRPAAHRSSATMQAAIRAHDRALARKFPGGPGALGGIMASIADPTRVLASAWRRRIEARWGTPFNTRSNKR